MPDYRCYVIDSDDHIRHAAAVVQCDTDAEALIEARRLHGNDACIEVWAFDRRVGTLYPEGSCGDSDKSLHMSAASNRIE